MACEAGKLVHRDIRELTVSGADFWFQAVNFLNAMARNVDFDKFEPPVMPSKGPQGGHKSPFAFDPMRRKAHVEGSDQ